MILNLMVCVFFKPLIKILSDISLIAFGRIEKTVVHLHADSRRGGRVVECGGLENH